MLNSKARSLHARIMDVVMSFDGKEERVYSSRICLALPDVNSKRVVDTLYHMSDVGVIRMTCMGWRSGDMN